MFPWYFIVVKDEAREKMSPLLSAAYRADEDKDAAPAKLELEGERFLRAPMAIIVVSRMREGKHPLWEQFLSAGAVCMNMSLACHALGYGVNWLSEWYSFSPTFRAGLGLDERDNIAGVMYIGNVVEQPEERDRPELAQIVTDWTGEGTKLNKGECYNKDGKALPDAKIFGL
jgi:nitroreductase